MSVKVESLLEALDRCSADLELVEWADLLIKGDGVILCRLAFEVTSGVLLWFLGLGVLKLSLKKKIC